MRALAIIAALAGGGLAVAACASRRTHEEHTAKATGFVRASTERAARGAPAVAVDRDGRVFVLDAINARIARVADDDLVDVAEVPPDSDDLAIGPDGAFAVHRSVKPEILVLDPEGRKVGVVDTSAVADVDGIALARSRRVLVTNSFQETFSLGSPAMPQLPSAILDGKRENDVQAVRTESGNLELRGADGATRVRLGPGDAARVIGTSGDLVCARVEHVIQREAAEAIRVRREAACVDMRTGRVALRVDLPPPGAFVPRRELAFAAHTLVFAQPTDRGIELQKWSVE
jgi:hypothetical protein